MSFLGSLGKALGAIGGTVGSLLGGPVGGAIGTGVGALASGLGSDADASEAYEQRLALQRDQQSYQMAENQKDRDFNAEQAELNRQYQTSEREAAQEWNSAGAQVQRMSEAGINASAVLSGSGGSSAAGTSSPMQGSPASASSSPLPAYDVGSAAEIAMQAQSTQGAYIKALSESAKNLADVGAKPIEIEKIYAEIGKITSEENLNNSRRQAQELSNQIVQLTGMRRAEADINNIIAQAQLSLQKKETEIQTTNLTAEQVTGQIFDNVYSEFRALLGKNNYKKALIDLKYYEQEWIERLNNVRQSTATLKSQESSNYADAAVARSVEVLNRDSHAQNQFNQLLHGFNSDGRPYDYAAFAKEQDALRSGFEKAINEADISSSEKERARAIARQANIAANFEQFNQTVGAIGSIIGTASNAGVAWSMVARSGSLGRLAQTQAAKLEYEMRFGTTSETHVYDSRGNHQGTSVTHRR